MTTPRKLLVDDKTPLFYHIVSRCVRRSWLCGYDPQTRRDYSHRKEWLESRLHLLGRAFSLNVYAYAIMNNHFHLVVYYDPTANQRWSNEEVVDRWLVACPPNTSNRIDEKEMREIRRGLLIRNEAQIERIRGCLGSLSVFMKLLKQPIARRANVEDECRGHFFEQRFYSGALLDEQAVLAAMAYVDLNPVRAKIARTIEEAKHTSVQARLQAASRVGLAEYLEPVVVGLPEVATMPMTTREYVDRLRSICTELHEQRRSPKYSKWHDQMMALKRPQRAYGSIALLKQWINQRSLSLRELALPN
ncbi:MAG: hypothetical protein GKR90_14705 [Pseudomonadales bacterium]|nr:hypothetical protein [Pseudomonadales bacterium]